MAIINDLGMRKPGSTLYIPFPTYDSNDPTASVTMTGLAVTDIEIYKDGSTTQRASDSGYTLLDTDGIDFDGITGIHGFSIDLSDNTTNGFYEAGSKYWVVVSSITVDAGVASFIAATFTIGYNDAMLNTTIATLAGQTSFTLEEGPADDNALFGCKVLIHDLASAIQIAIGYVSAYTGATKTITLSADPGIFTMAAGDNISVFLPDNTVAISGTAQTANDNGADINTLLTRIIGTLASGTHNAQSGDAYAIVNDGSYGNAQLVRSTTPANTLDVSATGESGLDFDNIKDATGAHTLTNITVPVTTAVTDRVTANTDQIEGADATDQIRDSILDDATRFSGANIDAAISSRAVAGDNMNLADNAITSAKYDESTAFPVASVDSGSTAIARTGADSDTLETLSDQIDSTSTHTAADVWTSTTRTLSSFGTLVADTVTAVWAALTSALTTAGSIGKKLSDWVLGSDNKTLLSTDAQSGVTIPTVTTVGTCTTNSDMVAEAPTANQNRDAILDDATRFSGANIDTTISSRSSHTAANVWAVGSRTLTSFGTLVADTATAVWAAVTRTLTGGGDATEAKQDTIISDISNLNNVSTTQVQSSCDSAITANSTIVAINAKTANLPSGIKKNVALNDFIFEMVLASDHITPATGLTVTCQIIKDGAAYVDSTNSVTEISAGSYKISFTQAEMNYGILAWKFTASTADQKVVVVITSA